MTVAVDWDGTLVDSKSQEWLPEALDALRRLLRDGHRVIIHTCRANWPEGLASIEAKLAAAGIAGVRVWTGSGKPHADLYVDNLAVRFDANWPEILRRVAATTPVPRGTKRYHGGTTLVPKPTLAPWPSWSS